jgi:sigma-B regulation protein RsbU (phosphoserine phosphatase)
VVDDEPDLELLISQRFRKRIRANELDFIFAANGAEALEKLSSDGLTEVVLTDINMPVMDGLTLLSRLHENHPLLRSVIVSAYGDMANIRTALNRGAYDFLTKPIDFQDLEITLDKTIREAEARKQAAADREALLTLTKELDVARRIQESLVPQKFPPYPERREFSIYGRMVPATQVGGDLFDFFLLDEHRLVFAIGDVSGKGVAAAMLMAVSRTLLRSAAMKGMRPHECLHEVNQVLRMERVSSMFVTCFVAVLDLRSGELEYSNAAHNPPLLLRADGGVEPTELTGGLVLGQFARASYQPKQARLAPGESILLYTDGVTEAMNPAREQFSDERFTALLGTLRGQSAEQQVQAVLEALADFAQGAAQSDDITLLNIAYAGAAEGRRDS